MCLPATSSTEERSGGKGKQGMEREKTREHRDVKGAAEQQKSFPFGGRMIGAVECKCYIINTQWPMVAKQVINLPWMCNGKYSRRSPSRAFSTWMDSLLTRRMYGQQRPHITVRAFSALPTTLDYTWLLFLSIVSAPFMLGGWRSRRARAVSLVAGWKI